MKRKIRSVFFGLTAAGTSLVMFISWTGKLPAATAKEIEASALKGFSLLQLSNAVFTGKARCASCHHSTMTAMVARALEQKGIAANDTTAQMREGSMAATLDIVCNPNLNNQFVTAKFLAPYELLGLDAEKHPADFTTDIAVDYIMSQALPDGSFKAEYGRVPLEAGDIHLTALSVRAVQLFASPAKSAKLQQMILRSKEWMEAQHPVLQQELSFQLLGMNWCGSGQSTMKAVAQKLNGLQNKDGGWSQLPTMQSDAYATGQVLYALSQSGLAIIEDPAYQKGIAWLLRTQDKTGAWIVKTRSNPIQPFVNSDFPPYDDNQFISAAATNWATLALVDALPDRNEKQK
jgi:Prenyltransferase and squalene oxidase repeat